ncbi:MAG: single-stranded DNA-binding protein [Spirochaetaceae bacterium]|nr:single-stranded DNA-binding protein [Spirochaetaceae bacterium]
MVAVNKKIITRTKKLSRDLEKTRSMIPDSLFVYNPLTYALDMHLAYIEKYAIENTKILFLGMNPGPFGMTQNGIPFGEKSFVKDYFHFDYEIQKPKHEHPSRPIQGLDCSRSEVSGKRFWSLMRDHYGNSNSLMGQVYVANYCPLVFLEKTKTAKNVTPDKLPLDVRIIISEICDEYLWDTQKILKCQNLIGIGKYAEKKLKNETYPYSSILHPSPASPLANKGWSERASAKLEELNIW